MFTGIVAEIGTVRQVAPTASGVRMEIRAPALAAGLAVGDSVDVAGACLTVAARDGEVFAADVVPETLARTTLGRLAPGGRVNLEGAARPETALGGHLVQGHVDGTVVLRSREPAGEGWRLRFELPPALARYVAEKGSVTVDGVSLTVAAVGERDFEVAIIPHTAARTTLGALRLGDVANIEVDIISKYVERLLAWRT